MRPPDGGGRAGRRPAFPAVLSVAMYYLKVTRPSWISASMVLSDDASEISPESEPIPTMEVIWPALRTTDLKSASANAHRQQRRQSAKGRRKSVARNPKGKETKPRKPGLPTDLVLP